LGTGFVVFGYTNNSDEDVVTFSNKICGFFLFLSVAMCIAMFGTIRIFGVLSQDLTMKIRMKLYKSVLRKPMEWFDMKQNSPGQLGTVLQTDCTTVNGVFGDIISQWFESLTSLFLGLGMGLYFNWRITLVALIVAPFLAIATWLTIVI